MGDITELLVQARSGKPQAQEALYASVYAELQRLARSKLQHGATLTDLDAPSLVHEVYLRLVNRTDLSHQSRGTFFAYAARVMRSVIVDYVRARDAQKRGGDVIEVTLTTESEGTVFNAAEIEELDSAMMALKQIDERCHSVVEMRYFAGLSFDEIAEALKVSVKTAQRDWQKARAFLIDHLDG